MVSGQQRRNLEYFTNKIVTFIVPNINRNFDEKQHIDYFVGKFLKTDDLGIWFEHPISRCRNFIFYDKIISISEEEIVYDENVTEALEQEEENIEGLQEIDLSQLEIQENSSTEEANITDMKEPDLPSSIDEFRKFIS